MIDNNEKTRTEMEFQEYTPNQKGPEIQGNFKNNLGINTNFLISSNNTNKISSNFNPINQQNPQFMANYYLNQNNSFGFNQPNFQNNNFKNFENSSSFQSSNQVFSNRNFQNISEINNSKENDEFSLLHTLQYVQEKYPSLIAINSNSAGAKSTIKTQYSPRFFVIKSFTEEDIHKSIKYSCWSSTREGNKKLTKAFLECKSRNSDLFLFFSMNGSGRFVGVAKMKSEVDENMIFEFWAMDDVWKGLFQVEWVFIKDIPNKFLKDIKLSNNAYKPVTNSRDTQEIPRNEGEAFIKIFEDFRYQTCILQHFQYYDERQDLFEKTRNMN